MENEKVGKTHLNIEHDNSDENQSLPPRSEIHKEKKKKTKVKIKYPVVRVLGLFFILLPITFLSYTLYFSKEELQSRVIDNKTSIENIDIVESETVENTGSEYKQNEKNESTNETSSDNKAESKTDSAKSETITNNSPSGQPSTQEQPSEQNKQEEDQFEIVYHKVQPQETLYRISMKYYKSREGEDLIIKWNNLEKNEIFVGQVLKIPIKK